MTVKQLSITSGGYIVVNMLINLICFSIICCQVKGKQCKLIIYYVLKNCNFRSIGFRLNL